MTTGEREFNVRNAQDITAGLMRDERTVTERKSRQSLCNPSLEEDGTSHSAFVSCERKSSITSTLHLHWSVQCLMKPPIGPSFHCEDLSANQHLPGSVSSAADFYFSWDRAQQDRERERGELEVHRS